MLKLKLEPLPYDYGALEPHISAETLRLHHGKHHKGYVDGVNDSLKASPIEAETLSELIHRVADDEGTKRLFNQAAQIWNHDLFWKSMSANGGGTPGGQLGRQLETDFGSYDVEFQRVEPGILAN